MPGDVQVEPISRAVTAHRTARWHRLVPAIVTDEWIIPMGVGNLRIECPFRKVFHPPFGPLGEPAGFRPKGDGRMRLDPAGRLDTTQPAVILCGPGNADQREV